jgi:alcohol dehydrogenase class IV
MHQAANLAGKAINLTTTTAAHAMSYKMSSLYGIAHGHAVALCLPATWERLLEDGGGDVRLRLDEIDALVCGAGASKGAGLARFRTLYDALDLPCPVADDAQLDLLARSVNTERLQNYPLELSTDEVRALYATILARCD